ncbi:hypothetical protein AK830_g6111 [Neonectria ditissima]|uniref:Calcineurin-like phosphoesterase domain-containing protein n=1 Tax=Neonectria ditissima TaxID=78410 RepID=A0A0P7B1W5_9HYPO|nr:hypothetical protein AK830_g6111 [Neonectria ditissima]
MISAAQRRFLVLASSLFFVSSLYICISRLVSMSYKPLALHPEEPEVKIELSRADLSMAYGTYGRPAYDGINLMGELPVEYIPTYENRRRLIIIGDIHGMLDPLNALLKKTAFDPVHDHVIAVGDIVNKGPKSAECVARLMELNASSVRGNHEDRVLVAWAGFQQQEGVEAYLDSDTFQVKRGESNDLKTARSLNETQIQWLRNLPVILTIESMSMYIVHAGLVPGVPLHSQDPWAVMNMRTMRFPREEFRQKEIERKKKAEEKERKKKEEEEKKKKNEFQQRSEVKSTADPDFDRNAEAGYLAAAANQAEADQSGSASKAKVSGALSVTQAAAQTHANTKSQTAGWKPPTTTVAVPEVPPPDLAGFEPSNPDHDIWIPVDNRDGKPWAHIWNHFQKQSHGSYRRSIVYGHDAKRGYQEDSYTFGLDSGCVKGHALSALVIAATEDGGWNHTTIQVMCKEPKSSWW